MSVSRCLGPFAREFVPDRAVMAERWKALPESCPATDCTRASCREVCAEWATVQFKVAAAKPGRTRR